MLDQVRGEAGERKLRLFAVACCYNVRHFLTDERLHHAVEVAERYADDLASEAEVDVVRNSFRSPYPVLLQSATHAALSTIDACVTAARIAAWEPVLFPKPLPDRPGIPERLDFERAAAVADAAGKRERNTQSLLLRDILGNVFRPATIDPAWPTPKVITLAQAIYEDRAVEGMPILGEALEEAGCDSQDILSHCRAQTDHVRGCWVVDAILGKS
jgi:hypothetical protein